LQSLGAKAKQATEEVGQLKLLQDKIHTNCESLKTELEFQFDALFELLSRRKKALIEYIVAERERRKQQLREQIGKCNSHLNKTTGLVQFCIEILKEPDPLAYLQVSILKHLKIGQHYYLYFA
jgi:tripartite motif-containing protein 9/67